MSTDAEAAEYQEQLETWERENDDDDYLTTGMETEECPKCGRETASLEWSAEGFVCETCYPLIDPDGTRALHAMGFRFGTYEEALDALCDHLCSAPDLLVFIHPRNSFDAVLSGVAWELQKVAAMWFQHDKASLAKDAVERVAYERMLENTALWNAEAVAFDCRRMKSA